MSFYQIFLPSATFIFILIVFVMRSVIIWKRTGINPLVFSQTENAHDFIGRVYKVMMLLTWLAILCYSFNTSVYQYLIPINYLDNESVKLLGAALWLISFIWTSVAQYQMSESWRIGIDYNEKTALVITGIFRYSRNPVFLGMIISYLATFLIIPNALTASMLASTWVVIQIQVRLEEEYLLQIHGQDYEVYRKKVSRWISL